MTSPQVPIEALLAQEDFIRRLALSLLKDEHEADDVVQQAWLKAIEKPPRQSGALRGWLSRVVRRLARDLRQKNRNRVAREALTARSETCPSVAEIQERESTRKLLVEALLALPDKYRDVLVLRFFEDLKPKEIAAKLGLPGSTLRSRQHRALQMLRERMQRSHSADRKSWRGALLSLLRPSDLVPGAAGMSWVTGILSMKKALLVLSMLALIMMMVIAVPWLELSGDSIEEVPLSPEQHVVGSNVRTDGVDHESRTMVADQAEDRRTGDFTGRLLDSDGRPVIDALYRVIADDFRPRHTNYAHRAWITFPEDGARTDANGGWKLAIAEPARGYLWFSLRDKHQVAFDVRKLAEGCVLRLPASAEFRISVSGCGPGEGLEIIQQPIFRDPKTGDWEQGNPSLFAIDQPREGPVFHVLGWNLVNRVGPVELVLEAVRGVDYLIQVRSDHYKRVSFNQARAPRELSFRLAEPLKTVEVEILEARGMHRATMGGFIAVKTNDWNCESFRGGQAVLVPSWFPARPKEWTVLDVRVILSDGEFFAGRAEANGVGPAVVRFVRGTGESALRLRLSDTARLSDRMGPYNQRHAGKVFVRKESGGLLVGEWLGESGWLDREFQALLGEDTVILVGTPKDWREVWIVLYNGSVARASRDDGEFHWLPTRALESMDLYSLWREHSPAQTTKISLRLKLDPTVEDVMQWTVVDAFTFSARRGTNHGDREVRARRLQWRKVVPVGIPYKMILWAYPDRKPIVLSSGQ